MNLTSDIAVNPNTDKIYVANHVPNSISVIDGKTNNVISNITTIGRDPSDIAINSNTDKIYVANYGSNTISVIDGKTDNVILAVPVKVNPSDIVINSNTDNNCLGNYRF